MMIGNCPVCGKRVCCANGRAPKHGHKFKYGWNKSLGSNHTPTKGPCAGWKQTAVKIRKNPKYW